MDKLQQPIAPEPYVNIGDKVKDEAGLKSYELLKTKYDTDLAEYNTKKSESDKSDKTEQNIKAKENIEKDTTMSAEDKKYALSLLERNDSTEPSTEPVNTESQKVTSITEEQVAVLELFNSIQADPVKKAQFDAIASGSLETVIAELLPKGRDISKLSDEDIVKQFYQLEDGATEEEVVEQMEAFKEMKGVSKRKEINKAKEALSKVTGNMSPELQKRLIENSKKNEEYAKETLAFTNKNVETASKFLEENLTSLIGKEFMGISITKEEAKNISDLVVKATPRQNTTKGLVLDYKTGWDIGIKAFVSEKLFEQNKHLKADLKKAEDFAIARFRPIDLSGGGNAGAAHRELAEKKDSSGYKLGKDGKRIW